MIIESFQHKPVLLAEVLEYLQPLPGKIFVDCTAGGGGHSSALLQKIIPGGKLFAFDQDEEAVEVCRKRLLPLGENNFAVLHSSFSCLQQKLNSREIAEVDGVLFDLGVSSYQLDSADRGFSYRYDAPLDMRMDQNQDLSAYELVNKVPLEELSSIIWDYGEERWAKRIAQFIVEQREKEPIKTTGQLVEVIKKAVPHGARREGPHPAKRTFQAIRIAVNKELDVLSSALEQAVKILKPGGRIAVISFHSLEDRVVKDFFKEKAQGCICPKELPICVCKRQPQLNIITRKPVLPKKDELSDNPRARSAKLRVAERVVSPKDMF